MAKRIVSLKDISKACGVSIATVSKALNDHSDISKDTKEKIREVAEQLGYHPNAAAQALKTNRSNNIGVLFVDEARSGLTHDYFNHVLEHFRRTAQVQGYDITFVIGKDSGRKMSYYDHCRYRGVDGVVMACVDFYTDEVMDLVRSNIPLVTIDHTFDGTIAICSNNALGMETLLDHVYQRGHRRIAYIHGENTSVTKIRMTSFYRSIQSLGLDIPDEYIRKAAYRDADKAAIETAELLNLRQPPTCILYPDDFAAFGGYTEIRNRGLRIPEDISIVGFDGLDAARVLVPRLTTWCQDTATIGRLAAEKLIDLIENPRTTVIEKYVVDGTLFTGGSVKTLKI